MIATLLAAAICGGLVHLLYRIVALRQRTTDKQLKALTAAVRDLQARVAELSHQKLSQGQREETELSATPPQDSALDAGSSIEPETLAVITAAASTFLGRKARIRSAQALPAADGAGAWAQQGRVFVQTSHNARPRQ